MTGRDDQALLAAHVAGDPEAFAELFDRHADRLWSLALRTVQHRQDAEEVLQEAMISAFRRAGGFRGDAAVGSWLYRIVLNACFDRLRKRRRVNAATVFGEDVLDRIASSTPGPEETAVSRAVAADVEAALGQLSADQRAALVLVDLEGHSMEQAAEILGCAPGTVKSRCSRGRAKLAPLLRHLVEA